VYNITYYIHRYNVCVLLSISSKHLVCPCHSSRRRHRTRIKHNYSFDPSPAASSPSHDQYNLYVYIIPYKIFYLDDVSCPTIEICPWLRSGLGPSNVYYTCLPNILWYVLIYARACGFACREVYNMFSRTQICVS